MGGLKCAYNAIKSHIVAMMATIFSLHTESKLSLLSINSELQLTHPRLYGHVNLINSTGRRFTTSGYTVTDGLSGFSRGFCFLLSSSSELSRRAAEPSRLIPDVSSLQIAAPMVLLLMPTQPLIFLLKHLMQCTTVL